MRELKVVISLRTGLSVQEVVDKLFDGNINLAGRIESVVVEEGKARVDYTPEEL